MMEQPYEKCLENGPGSLSDAELLAVILRCGARGKTSLELAREILSLPGKEEQMQRTCSSLFIYYLSAVGFSC